MNLSLGETLSLTRHRHETNVPAEQPQAKANPRLPGPHEDEGGSAGAEAASAEGPEAGCGVGTGLRAAPGKRLKRGERLTRAADYRRILRTGIRLEGPLFSLLATWNDRGHDRLGLAASRRVGGAVLRNRAKRLLRESFRRHRAETERGRDLVLLAKREIGACSQAEVDLEYRERLGRLASRMWRRRAVSPLDD